MRLVRNVGAGIFASMWTAVLGLAVVPLYLRYLGIEAYGLIGFFATIQALFQLLDLGIQPTVNREIARGQADGRIQNIRVLLRSLEFVYWLVALGIGLLMGLLSPLIGGSWIHAKSLSNETIAHALFLMGLVIAARWPTGLYQSTLNGLQKVVLTSTLTVITGSLGSLGAVLILAFVSRTIEGFFIWQATIGVFAALITRWFAWRQLGGTAQARPSVRALRAIWRFSVSMTALTFSGLIFSQLDRVLLSKLLGLQAFGQYVLAGVVASALSMLISPFYNALYPHFSAYCISGDQEKLMSLYRLSGRMLSTLLFSVALVLVIGGREILSLWTGNPGLADQVAPIAAILAVGTAIHGTMYIPHAVQLALGKTFIPLTINVVLLVLMVPTTVAFALAYGALGGAICWLLLHVLYVFLSVSMMGKFVSQAAGFTWLFREVGIPFAVCTIAALVGHVLLASIDVPPFARVIVTVLVAIAAFITVIAISHDLKHQLFLAAGKALEHRLNWIKPKST